jgi:hypothetical protein
MSFHDTDMDMMDKESEQLTLDVIDGNPGAGVIVCLLLSSPLWRPILQVLKSQHLIGSELWRVVPDEYDDDWECFVQQLFNAPCN